MALERRKQRAEKATNIRYALSLCFSSPRSLLLLAGVFAELSRFTPHTNSSRRSLLKPLSPHAVLSSCRLLLMLFAFHAPLTTHSSQPTLLTKKPHTLLTCFAQR